MTKAPGEHNSKHGAAAAERALSTGDEFIGLAAAQQERVLDELDYQGIDAIMRRDAVRLQVVADLYYAAILGAESLEKFDAYVKRFGWIAASAMRAWQAVKVAEKQAGVRDVHDVLAAIRSGGSDDQAPQS